MNVLLLTHRLPYAPNRGDRIRSFHLLRTLATYADVDLLSLVHDAEEASHADEIAPLVRSVTLARVGTWSNRTRALVALATNRPLTHALLDSPDVPGAIERLCAAQRPDVVLSYCSGVAQYLFHRKLTTVPAVLDMVDVDSVKWAHLADSTPRPKSWILRREARVLSRFEARAASHAYATLTVNDREHRALSEIASSARIVTIENGIDAHFFAPPDRPSDAPNVVFCGVMNYAPNEAGAIWMAQKVWPLVRARRPNATLTIVGAQPTPQVARLATAAAGVAVTGQVPDVRPYLWNAAIAVAPIWIARGLQNKVLEALAAGLPCVVTPMVDEGLPAAMREGWLTARDAEQFAAHVITLLSMPAAERRRMADRSHVVARDWAAQLQPLQAILRDAATSRPAS